MCVCPDWLNNDFLETALNSQSDETCKVLSSEIERATAPGDNYGSDMYRVIVNTEKNGVKGKISVIIKAEVQTGVLKKLIAEVNAFGREIGAFTVALPTLKRMLDDASPHKYQPYGAKCYYTHTGPPSSVLVLEDLKVDGFRLADKCTTLDMNHCFLVVRRLASYQAASVVMFTTDPDKMKIFKRVQHSETMKEKFQTMFRPVLVGLIKEAETWPECKGPIVDKLNELASTVGDRDYTVEDDVFNVLTHGDIWINNLMFKYSEETKEVLDVRLVDLQTCAWTSPVLDLLYCICANASEDVLENHHVVVDEYYNTLSETFAILGYKHLCPKREHIHDEFHKRSTHGAVLGILIRSFIFADRNNLPDVDKMLSVGGVYFSDLYKQSMRKVLPIYYKKGWL